MDLVPKNRGLDKNAEPLDKFVTKQGAIYMTVELSGVDLAPLP